MGAKLQFFYHKNLFAGINSSVNCYMMLKKAEYKHIAQRKSTPSKGEECSI